MGQSSVGLRRTRNPNELRKVTYYDRLVLRCAKNLSGDCDFSRARHRLLLRQVHLQGDRARIGDRHPHRRRCDWANRHHDQPAAQGVFVPHVPVRRWLRRRTAIRARDCEQRPAAGDLLCSAGRIQSGSLRDGCKIRRVRHGVRGRTLLGVADDRGLDGTLDRRQQSTRPGPRSSEGATVAVAGEREVLVTVLGAATVEVEDRELLAVPVEGVDVLVTNKEVDGKTIAELATRPAARGVFLRKITRGATATDIPVLPGTKVNRGDLLTLVGRTSDTTAATKMLGVADRPTDVTDMAFVGLFIVVGALIGSLVFKVAGAPLTLSTAGGALIFGIIGGWLRSVRPKFGRIPTPTVWFMNSVGLNIFIAIVGISAGPGFINGLKTQGIGLFLWGAVATTVPLILGMLVAKFVFRFHDALTLGIVSGSRTTTASLGLVCDQAKSQIPALGYTVTYAVGNTLLTIWGMVIIMLLS